LQNTFSEPTFEPPTPTTTPDYAKIYRFLAGLFDPKEVNHQAKLNEMRQVDRETTQLLMHNLAINLTNRSFTESHKGLAEQRKTLESSCSSNNSRKQTPKQETVEIQIHSPSNPTEPDKDSNNFSDTCFLVNK